VEPANVLRRRLLSGLFVSGLFVGALVADVYLIGLDVLLTLIWAVGTGLVLREFYVMNAVVGMSPFRKFGVSCGVTLVILHWLSLPGTLSRLVSPEAESLLKAHLVPGGLVLTVCGTFLLQATKRDNDRAFASIASTLLGIIYVWFLLSFAMKLRHLSVSVPTPAPGAEGTVGTGGEWLVTGTWLLAAMVATTKVSDIAAYFGGSLIGRHKLILRISPGKTWEGAVCGFLGGIGASVLVQQFALGDLTAGAFSVWHAVLFGAVVGFFGQMGDLAESMMKRGSGTKDSGGFIPGYGGLFDVADSILTAGPPAYFMAVAVL